MTEKQDRARRQYLETISTPRGKMLVRWKNIIQRCTNPNNTAFRFYGGRGIKIADEWLAFDQFYADMGDPPFEGASIDRVDNDGPYAPWNCRWATRSEQYANRRPNQYEGASRCVNGHEFTPENTINTTGSNGNPRRVCRECGRIAQRSYQDRKRQAVR